MSYLDDKQVDHWTLLQLFERGTIAFECCRCWRIAKMDLQRLVDRCGIEATVGQIEQSIRCERCGSRKARALVHLRGIRGDRAWRPCPPRAGR